MDDGPRNEKARQKHRELRKELCGCISLPSNVIVTGNSSVDLPKQELNEENYFGWTVYERAPADREYHQLKHQESVGQDIPCSRSPRPAQTRGGPCGSFKRVHQSRVGPRNEAARLRHRQLRKEEFCCESVTSRMEDSGVHIGELSEDNHFGWEIYGRSFGDPEFEKLMHFHEKPDNTGDTFQKKTYVLYLKEGTVAGRDVYTSTDDSKVVLPIGDLVNRPHESKFTKKGRKVSKKEPGGKENQVSESTKERSRFPKTELSRQNTLDQLTDYPVERISEVKRISNVSKLNKESGDLSRTISKEILDERNRIGSIIKNRGSFSQYLRAGCNNKKRTLPENGKPGVLQKVSEFIVNFKQSDGSTITKDWEYLLATPSGTNEFLYLSNKNVKK